MSDLGNKQIMAENILYYMSINEKTRNDICRDLEIKYTTLTGWITAEKYPRIDKIEILASYFGISKADLVEKRNTTSSQSLTLQEQKIGRAYGKAAPPVKRTVEVALEPYMEESKTEFAAELAPEIPDETKPKVIDEPAVRRAMRRCIPLHVLPASAGSGEFLDSNDFDMVEVGDDVPMSANYGVRVSGRSMEPDYPDGWIVWVKRADSVDVGEVGVFAIENEGYIKELGEDRLISQNPEYPDVKFYEGIEVHTYGVVVGVSEDIY